MLALKLGNSINTTPTGYNIASVDLNGTDEYIDIGESKGLYTGQAGSCSIWFTIDDTSTSSTLWQARVDSNNYVNVFYHNGSTELRIAYRLGGSTKLASHTVDFEGDGNFHHVLATWSTTRIQIFVDGTLQDTNTFTGTFTGTFANSMIGQNTLNGNYLHGKVAHLGLFTREMTIADVYVADREPIDLTGKQYLVAYYKLDAGSGAVAFDGSGNDNNGTLENTPTWSTDVPFKAD
jgi:hypothetical protein